MDPSLAGDTDKLEMVKVAANGGGTVYIVELKNIRTKLAAKFQLAHS
jgi:hypothetical protein